MVNIDQIIIYSLKRMYQKGEALLYVSQKKKCTMTSSLHPLVLLDRGTDSGPEYTAQYELNRRDDGGRFNEKSEHDDDAKVSIQMAEIDSAELEIKGRTNFLMGGTKLKFSLKV